MMNRREFRYEKKQILNFTNKPLAEAVIRISVNNVVSLSKLLLNIHVFLYNDEE